MNNREKLYKVLKYAKENISHPEASKFITPIYTDGVIIGYPPSSKSLKEQFDSRISKIENYEEFVLLIDGLIEEYEPYE